MTLEYRYAGPDGAGVGALSPGAGAVIGSEYCVYLLPGAPEIARACDTAAARGIPLVLLTPWFRDAELKRMLPLFRAIPGGADVAVAVNDWGTLLALRVLFPRLRLTIGRLLSAQKRCPRIEASPQLSEADRAWHREGLFSCARARRFLSEEFGVSGFHVDVLPGEAAEGTDAPGAAGLPALFLHEPYAIVTVSDACPWLGGRSSSCVTRCPRLCRDGVVVLREPSMAREMIQRGKARIVRGVGSPALDGLHGPLVRRVFYDDLP